MNDYILPVILQIVGFLVIIAEIFIPSLGLLTAIAVGIYGVSLYLVFSNISTTAGLIFTAIDITIVPILLIAGMKLLAKSPLALKQELSKSQGVVSQRQELKQFLDKQGTAVTDLRPSGTIEVEHQRLDAVTDGEYLEKGSAVVIKEITGNRIVVEKIN